MGTLVQLTEEQRKISSRVNRSIRLMQRAQQERSPQRQIQDRPPVREENATNIRPEETNNANLLAAAPAPAEQPVAAPENAGLTVAISESRPMYFAPMPPVPIFKGILGGKHPVKFIGELETYFKKLNIPAERQLEVVNESLVDAAQDWAAIFKPSWLTFANFRRDFLGSYWSEQEQNKLRNNISTTQWTPASRRTMEAHFAHYVGLARLLTNRIPDEVLVTEIIKHFPAQIQSLWTLKTERNIATAAEFLRQQENILGTQAFGPPAKRFRQYPEHNYYIQNSRPSGNDRRSSQEGQST